MSFINQQNGKPIKETAILLEIGMPSAVTGRTYQLDDSLRRAVRAMDGKTVYMEFGTRTRSSDLKAVDHNYVCGEITNIKLIENRSTHGHAVIVGDVRPFGPQGVRLRDTITGADGGHNYYSINSNVRLIDKKDPLKLSIAEICGCNLVDRQ